MFTLPETHFLHPKKDGRNTIVPFGARPTFRGELLVLGRVTPKNRVCGFFMAYRGRKRTEDSHGRLNECFFKITCRDVFSTKNVGKGQKLPK